MKHARRCRCSSTSRRRYLSLHCHCHLFFSVPWPSPPQPERRKEGAEKKIEGTTERLLTRTTSPKPTSAMHKAPDREVNLQHPKAGAGPLPPTFRSPIGLDADLARSHQVPSPPALCILLSAFQVLPPPPSEMPGLAPATTSTNDNLRLCTKDVYRARARFLILLSPALSSALVCFLSLSLLWPSSLHCVRILRFPRAWNLSARQPARHPPYDPSSPPPFTLPGRPRSLARDHQPYPTARSASAVHDLLIHVDSNLPLLVPLLSKSQLSSLARWIPSGLRDRLRVGLASLLSLS